MMKTLAIDLIVTDAGTQMRAGTRMETVKEYTELASKEGWAFTTPLVVFFDGERYFLADGFHRYEACMLAKRASVQADIRRGTLRDAIKFALGANQTHGLRRSNDDKRNAVLVALNDPEWGKMSSRAIADMCGVSHEFVQKMRSELSTVDSSVEPARVGKDGKERRLPAAKANSEPKPEPEPPQFPDDLPPDWPFDDERPDDEPGQPDDQPEPEVKPSKKDKVEPTEKEKASLLKSAIKQHNAAMMRLIDDLNLVDPNKGIHERMLQRFRDNHEDMESWK